jgi:hypothetical protein
VIPIPFGYQVCKKKEDAGGDVSAPGAEQRLPAAPGSVPGVPGHMGGLWLLLGLQHMEEPPLPGTARGYRPRIFHSTCFPLFCLWFANYWSLGNF